MNVKWWRIYFGIYFESADRRQQYRLSNSPYSNLASAPFSHWPKAVAPGALVFLVAFDFLLAAFQPALNVRTIVKNIVDTTL